MKVEWKGGNLTKKRAAFLCWKMWEWIAETLTQKMWEEDIRSIAIFKTRWPGWTSNGGNVSACDCDCPTCENADGDCDKCILRGAWGKFGYCLASGSPYKRMGQLRTVKPVKKRARIIANAAKKVYEGCK